jgi:hypothetical protein
MLIRQEFSVHLLNELGIDAANKLAEVFTTALEEVEKLVPPGRERSVVITKLQEAAFFAKRGMAVDPANQKKEG